MSTQRQDAQELARQVQRNHALIAQLKTIRALHMTAYTTSTPIDVIAAEFFYAVGDIFEGQQPEELRLKHLDRAAFLKEVSDGTQ